MPSKRFLAVANPRCGAKRALAIAEKVSPVFADADAELDVHLTQHAGHATEIVDSIDLSTYHGVCVIGGDGTTHEVVAGLMQRGEVDLPPIGLIPAGTGNALHHHLRCGAPLDAAHRIVQGQAYPLDVVRVTMEKETAYCINIVGWGAVADISRKAETLRFLRRHRYAVATLMQILFPTPRHITVTLDDEVVEDEFLFVLACNTRTAGSGMLAAPHAEVDDGLMDVVLLRNTSRWQAIKLFTKVYDGSHLSLPCVEYRQVRLLEIRSEDSGLLNLDGETKGVPPFVAEVLPGALQVFR